MSGTETVYQQLGGEQGVRALVDAFYTRMDSDARFKVLRALHPLSLDGSRDKLFWFLCGWSGGPDHFVQRFGHPRLRARHLPFSIGVLERDQWLQCMDEAMAQCELPQSLHRRLRQSFLQTADWMRNRAEPDIPG
ncbi:MAG: group II truncated hemoglobin [Gammaproteobacteria bacterium]|nr:group II truncated hemoglobin [Gammaproteobacteria bacterium]